MGEELAPACQWADQIPRAANQAVMRGHPIRRGWFKLRPYGGPHRRIDKVVDFSYFPSIKYKNPNSR